jgi:hypothetical protein
MINNGELKGELGFHTELKWNFNARYSFLFFFLFYCAIRFVVSGYKLAIKVVVEGTKCNVAY